MASQYRCETCKLLTKEPAEWGFDPYCHITVPIKLDNWEWVKRWGCASHSDFQNQREKVLDEVEQIIKQYKPMARKQDGYMFKDEIFTALNKLRGGHG